MTESQKLQQEINEINAKLAESQALKVECDFPEIKRTYTYRKSPAIKANDLYL